MADARDLMDDIDREILNRIQGEFPVCEDPYGEIGRASGVSREEALSRVRGLVGRGVIRKVGPFFDSKKMDHASTLCAVEVPMEKIEETAGIINSYAEVTHNYLREGTPNIWFTVIARSRGEIERILTEISLRAGVGPIRDLPAVKTFKIKVDLRVAG